MAAQRRFSAAVHAPGACQGRIGVCVGMGGVRWVCCTAVTVRGRLVLARLCALQNVPPLGPRKVIVPDWCEYVVL